MRDGTRLRYFLYGLGFLGALALFAVITLAFYMKAFTSPAIVTLRTDRAGLQLLEHSDVKIRGVLLGEVRQIKTTPGGAELVLALDPDKIKLVDRGATARLMPKTLFGEKYVDLIAPATPTGRPLASGDAIRQDTSTRTVELEKIFNELLPLLEAVKPEQLNATLNALATALQGRGAQIGESFETLDDYLRKINPHMPIIEHDIAALADVTATYDQAAPDLLRLLRNSISISDTIVAKRDSINASMKELITLADNTRVFLAANENRIVGVQFVSRDALATLARYSPQVPCLFEGLVRLHPLLEEATRSQGKAWAHFDIEFVKTRPAYKYPNDLPAHRDYRNPRCYGMPTPPVPSPQYQIRDGTEDNPWWEPQSQLYPRALAGVLTSPWGGPGTSEEKQMVNMAMAPAFGTDAAAVPDIAGLLFAPMARGAVVSVE